MCRVKGLPGYNCIACVHNMLPCHWFPRGFSGDRPEVATADASKRRGPIKKGCDIPQAIQEKTPPILLQLEHTIPKQHRPPRLRFITAQRCRRKPRGDKISLGDMFVHSSLREFRFLAGFRVVGYICIVFIWNSIGSLRDV